MKGFAIRLRVFFALSHPFANHKRWARLGLVERFADVYAHNAQEHDNHSAEQPKRKHQGGEAIHENLPRQMLHKIIHPHGKSQGRKHETESNHQPKRLVGERKHVVGCEAQQPPKAVTAFAFGPSCMPYGHFGLPKPHPLHLQGETTHLVAHSQHGPYHLARVDAEVGNGMVLRHVGEVSEYRIEASRA